MPDDENPGGTPEDDPEDETTKDQQKESDDKKKTESAEDLAAKLASAEARIKELNKESTDRRKKLEKLEGDDKKRKEAEMSDLEKAQTRLKELEDAVTQRDAALRTTRIQTAVERTATKLKFRDPEDAYRMILPQLKDVEIDEAGNVKGVEELLKGIAKAKPYLLNTSTPDAPPTDHRTDSKKDKDKEEERLKREFGL